MGLGSTTIGTMEVQHNEGAPVAAPLAADPEDASPALLHVPLNVRSATLVLLTVLANAIGFGMMMIARHRGLASLGEIMAIGSLACLVAALFVMPPIAASFLRFPKPTSK